VRSNGSWFVPSGDSGKPAGALHQVPPLWLFDHSLTQEDRRTVEDLAAATAIGMVETVLRSFRVGLRALRQPCQEG
jgi:hypothetical protein